MIRSTWAMPLLLAALTIAALVVALAGDGWCDRLGWLGLAAPLFAIGRAVAARRT